MRPPLSLMKYTQNQIILIQVKIKIFCKYKFTFWSFIPQIQCNLTCQTTNRTQTHNSIEI